MEDKSLESSMIDDIKKRLEVMQVMATITDDITKDGNVNIGDFYAHDVNYLLTQNATLQSQITDLKEALDMADVALTDIRGLHSACQACAITSGDDECVTYQLAHNALAKAALEGGKP